MGKCLLSNAPVAQFDKRFGYEPKGRTFESSCDDHPTTTQQCDWYEPRSPHTKAFDQSLLRQLINSTVSDVARKQEVRYDSVLGAINRGVERCVNWSDFTELKVIGMDEIALRKGHRDFVVIVTLRRGDDDIALLASARSEEGDGGDLPAIDPARIACEHRMRLH